MAIYSQLLRGQRVGMDKMVVDKAPCQQNKTGIAVTVAILFDGTGNNRNNVAQRHMSQHNTAHPHQAITQEDGIAWARSYEKHSLNKKGASKGNSYAGGFSNVFILERLNIKRELDKKKASIYVEGIGTINNGDDSTLGNAIGTGSTGIPARVMVGTMRIAENIAEIMKDEENAYVEHVTIDVFGFSRGGSNGAALRWPGRNGHGESNFPLSWKQQNQPANGLETSTMRPFRSKRSAA